MALNEYPTLSAMGGGIRGVIQARLWQRLEARVPGFLAKPVRLAGTSIGGINALYVACGKTPAELMEFYTQRAKDIFQSRGILDQLTPDELFRADFAHEDIYAVLTDAFGDRRMEDLEREVLIPVFDMRTWGPKFYERSDRGVLVRDVARMTSAAPTYWPSHLWSLDGGLYANNPSDSVVATTLREMRRAGVPETELAGKISCLSFGTGRVPHQPPTDEPNYDAGILDMIPMILNVVMDGSVEAAHFRTRQALNGRYHLVQPELPSAIDLKAVDKLDELISIADLYPLGDVEDWLQRVWGLEVAGDEPGATIDPADPSA